MAIFVVGGFMAGVALIGDWRRQLRPLWSPGHLDVVHPILRLGRTHLFVGLAIVVARWPGGPAPAPPDHDMRNAQFELTGCSKRS